MDNRFGCWDQAISYIAFFSSSSSKQRLHFFATRSYNNANMNHSCSNDQRYYSGQYLQKKEKKKEKEQTFANTSCRQSKFDFTLL